MFHLFSYLIFVFVFSFFQGSAFAATGEFVAYNAEKGKGRIEISMTSTDLKLEMDKNSSANKMTVLFNNKSKVTTVLDHKKKEYFQVDKKAVEKIKSTMKMVQEAMKNVPPQMQAMMKQKMGGASAPIKSEVKKVGSGIKVKSWKTDHYKVMQKGSAVAEYWVVPFNKSGITGNHFKIFKDMAKFYESMMAGLPQFQSSASQFSGWQKFSGLPVKIIQKKKAFYLDKAQKKSFSAGEFGVPKGYKKNDIMANF